VKRRFDLMNCSLEEFVQKTQHISLVSLNTVKCYDISCSCGWYLKKYMCDHIIALEVNSSNVRVPMKFKNVAFNAH
jgi:hypothetical protein